MGELELPDPDSTATAGALGPAAHPIRLLAPGTELADRYEVREVLGRGGYAVVYLAWDRALRREIALKVLRADRFTESTLTRFRREAAIAREVESPHLVRIFDIGQSGQTVYLTMERVVGQSLRQRLESGSLLVEEALHIARQVLEGLASLHRLSIVHRDVKPANILLTAEGQVRLADFGLARRWDRDETRATEDSALVGTLEYVSPEQALGEPLDARSDLYAFGVVLFEMLTGRLPYSRASSLGTVLAHLSDRPLDPRRCRPELPRWLARIVLRLLEKKRGDRFASADEVLGALRSCHSLPRLRRSWAAAALSAAALLPLAWWGAHSRGAPLPRPRFDHFTQIEQGSGLQGIGANGTVLWRRAGIHTEAALLRGGPGMPSRILCFMAPPGGYLTPAQRTLTFLEPETGAVVDRVAMPSPGDVFGMSDLYSPEIRLRDLDHDGHDEVLVSFFHLYWPSFTVLYEPRLRRARLLLVAAGHHRPVAYADVDGDGRDEVLFSGISNRIGHYVAAAAVRVVPPVDAEPQGSVHAAYTPDSIVGRWHEQPLWYALLPPGACVTRDCVTLDATRHLLRFDRGDHPAVLLGIDGFLAGTTGHAPGAERERARQSAYTRLAEGVRLLDAGFAAEARREIASAIAGAQAAGDPILLEWARRCGVRAAIAAGMPDAEAEARALYASATVPVDVAYEAATALHLRGEAERAVEWYRRAFARDPTDGQGQQRNDVLLGLLMADVERQRWDEAASDVQRFGPTIPGQLWEDVYGRYLEWRRGGRPQPYDDIGSGTEDHRRCWALEMRWRLGEPAARLLPEVRRAAAESSEARYLFRSLEAALLLDEGRAAESLLVARDAYEATVAALHREVLARGHLEIVAGRLAAALRAGGQGAAAVEVERGWRRLLRGAASDDSTAPRRGGGPSDATL